MCNKRGQEKGGDGRKGAHRKGRQGEERGLLKQFRLDQGQEGSGRNLNSYRLVDFEPGSDLFNREKIGQWNRSIKKRIQTWISIANYRKVCFREKLLYAVQFTGAPFRP
jgi:hypothetical protein